MASGLKVWILTALCCPLVISAYNYLQFTPGTFKGVGSRSHLHIASQIAQTLVNKGGHHVTLVTTGDDNMELPGVNVIQSEAAFPDETFVRLGEIVKRYTASQALGTEYQPEDEGLFLEVMEGQCYAMLTDTNLFHKLTKEKFDYAIVDHYHGCGYLLVKMLEIPYMVLECSTTISTLVDTRTAHPLSFVPTFGSQLSDSMSFLDRVKNSIVWPAIQLLMMPMVDGITVSAHKRAGILPDSDISQLRREGELWFVNNDWSMEFPRPINPNTIFIGGILAAKEPKPLSKELQTWISTTPGKGTVIVSFGSAMDISDIPQVQKVLFDGFRELPYRIIMTLKAKIPDLPSNVKVMEWIPQSDLLALQNETKLLITHGGINSIYEAIYWSVPLLVFPLTMDGPDNAVRVETKGFGLRAELRTLTSEELVEKITRIVDDPSFKKNAEKASSIMKDTPQTPTERVLFWVEYITRHGNGKHLRSKALDLNWWQYLMLDVILFFIVLITLILGILFAIIKCTCRRICNCLGFSKKPKQKEKSS